LIGKVLRSPHAHARILSIDTSKARALKGVKAVVTSADFDDLPSEFIPAGEMMVNFRDMTRSIMAREKVLFEGHPLAAVAAISDAIASEALTLIDVRYEVLPHVMDVNDAMRPGAPLLHEDMYTIGVEPKPAKPSNVTKRVEFGFGDLDAGFAKADLIVERDFLTRPVHQGYIEPHTCLASVSEDGQAELWVTTQGQYIVRAFCAKLLGMEVSKLRVTASEIGGGFGGKTVVYLEPLALALSRKACQPVKMTMSRTEVFRASGPTSGARIWVKIGVTKDGKITAADALLKYQAGAFQGSPVQPGAMCAFAPYALENVRVIGYDVVVNRSKVAAYRAPGGPISEYAVESVMDEIALKLKMDPIELRLKNAAKEGTKTPYGPKLGPVGLIQTLEAARAHPHYSAPLKANQGRGLASGFWFNIGGETCASLNVGEDGTISLLTGCPDIGGSRASLSMMAAEELGVPLDSVRAVIADTSALGYNFLTGGSRVTFSSGMAVVEAAREVIQVMRTRAAKIWEVPLDDVEWVDGGAHQVSGDKSLPFAEIAKTAGKTGGPIIGNAAINATGAGPSFATHIVDVEVDPDTGKVSVVRYTAIQDAGRAIHPSYVEGQMQGGAVQGIGWALNEEYIYNSAGKLENPGFLDYRIPVCSDVPMIDTVIVEVPNPRHPYGVRGVGETPIVPPMGAIANAVSHAAGTRLTELPMSPPRVLAAMEARG
ncbi:MAG: xanthine dehydrogenase family protein molybdopterin-binding subunit, partial [Betaproteobacteria bacterium]|nr:xanthine dehydrogenase family protein molybdopterin-binding subunit [Betaproteobacteria bacterium]